MASTLVPCRTAQVQRQGAIDAERRHCDDKIDAVANVAHTFGPDDTYDPVDAPALVLAIASMWFITPEEISAHTTAISRANEPWSSTPSSP